jgi:hypothetical protein
MAKDQDMKRRDFISSTLAGGLGLGLFILSGAGEVLAATARKSVESKVEPEESKVGKLKDLELEKGKKPPKCQKKKNTKCGMFIAH